MPESPRWYEARGRHAEAEALLQRIEAEAGAPPLPPLAVVPPPPPSRASAAGLFRPPLLAHILLAMLLMACVNIAVYAFTAWVPTILVQHGITIASTLLFTSLMQIGSLPGALFGAWAAERLGRRPGLIAVSLAAAAVSAGYAFMRSPPAITLTGFILVLLLYALVAMTFGTYVPEIFPTPLRLTGSGIANAAGRTANVFAPYCIVFLLSRLGPSGVYFSVAGVLVLQALAVALLAHETRQKSLEQISEIRQKRLDSR